MTNNTHVWLVDVPWARKIFWARRSNCSHGRGGGMAVTQVGGGMAMTRQGGGVVAAIRGRPVVHIYTISEQWERENVSTFRSRFLSASATLNPWYENKTIGTKRTIHVWVYIVAKDTLDDGAGLAIFTIFVLVNGKF